MDDTQPEMQELLTLQRQTLAKLNGLVEAIASPKQITIERDAGGAITGARVEASDETRAS
jgi:hypothetical protein